MSPFGAVSGSGPFSFCGRTDNDQRSVFIYYCGPFSWTLMYCTWTMALPWNSLSGRWPDRGMSSTHHWLVVFPAALWIDMFAWHSCGVMWAQPHFPNRKLGWLIFFIASTDANGCGSLLLRAFFWYILTDLSCTLDLLRIFLYSISTFDSCTDLLTSEILMWR